MSDFGQLNKLVNQQIQRINSKQLSDDIDWNHLIINAHRFYALKQRFNQVGLNIDDISFLNYEKTEEQDTILLQLELYGFISVDKTGDTIFDKEIFADFFISEYIIKNFFSVSNDIHIRESILIHKLLEIILKNPEDYQIICKFIINYLKVEGLNQTPRDQMLGLVSEDTKQISEDILKIRNRKILRLLLELWSLLLSSKVSSLNNLWQSNVDRGVFKRVLLENFLQDCIKKDNIDYEHFLKVIDIVDQSFKSGVHSIFQKSDIATVSKAAKSKETDADNVHKFHSNLLNVLNLINLNFDKSEAKLIYRIYFYELKLIAHIDEKICMEILSIANQLYDKDKNDIANLIILFIESNNFQNLGAVVDKISEVLKDNEISLTKVLTYEYSSEKHPIIRPIMSMDLRSFFKVSELYANCPNSWSDVQNHFVYVYNFPSIFLHLSHPFRIEKFIHLMIQIFRNNKEFLLNFANKDHTICIKLLFSEEKWFYFNMFADIFFKDKENAKKMIRKILFREYIFENHPFYKAVSEKCFMRIKNIYEEFKNNDEEIQDIFINSNNDFLKIFNHMDNNVYKEFMEFFNKYFEFDGQMSTEKQIRSQSLKRELRTFLRKPGAFKIDDEHKKVFRTFLMTVFKNESKFIQSVFGEADPEN